MTTKHSYT